MTKRDFILPDHETLTITAENADKLILAGNGDAALVYLYILKNRGELSVNDLVSTLKKSENDIILSLSHLKKIGLLKNDEKPTEPRKSGDTLPKYKISDIEREIQHGSAFSLLVDESQRALGRILAPDELILLFSIYDNLSIPPEVLLLILHYCITENNRKYGAKRPVTIRFVEKVAYSWDRDGLTTLQKAEEHLKNLDFERSALGEIKRILKIRDRELVASERRYIDSWIEMGMHPKAIGIAYDKTILKTGKLSWGYIDSIIKSWHGKGLLTADDIEKHDAPPQGAVRDAASHTAPDTSDIERMKKLLKRIKGG